MELTKSYLENAYLVEGKSTHAIAKATGINQTKIRSLLIRYGIPLRSKSAAQANALDKGVAPHPTKGKKQSKVVKEKISESMCHMWQHMNVEEKDRRSELGQQQWEGMSPQEREKLQAMAGKALRAAAKTGSRLEKFLLSELRIRGYKVEFHSTNVVVREQLEVDLLLPANRIAIEIDGPAHFFPIWGEENLAKHKLADSAKNGLLMQAGYRVIRVKHLAKSLTEKHKRILLSRLLPVLENWPDKSNRLMEIELK